jgi:polysaccharide pyruvyl transferase WcaK-like protein
MPHTIVIAGYYGFGNTGDELILEAMICDLRGVMSEANITVLSGKPRQTASRYQVNSISWMDIRRIAQSISSADLVILGSGGIFHDYWGFDDSNILTSAHIGISFYTSLSLLAFIHHKPLMLDAVGVGPLVSEKGKAHVKAIAEQAALITVRDRQSRDVLMKWESLLNA